MNINNTTRLLTGQMLTKYPIASFRELLVISFPLMLSALSTNLMLFVDRSILAHYSITAMNSAAASGMVSQAFLFPAMSIAAIAEIFVGQYNGARHYDKVAEPVWQMIWFALCMLILFLPLATLGAELLIPKSLQQEGIPYFKLIMYSGPTFPIISALSAFFAARGNTIVITWVTVLGNVFNLIMDIFLIFGIDGVLPALGTTGAALATIMANLLQILILGIIFLNAENRKKYNTLQCGFVKETFLNCLKFGAPSALGHAAELLAWSTLYHVADAMGIIYVTVYSMGQNIFILFAFLTDGMNKGVIAISSNLIGGKCGEKINKLIKSAIKLHLIIVLIVAVPLILYRHILVDIFKIDVAVITMGPTLAQQTSITLIFAWLYLVFDGMVWCIAGILTSAGDTKFIMINNALCSWLFGVIPVYVALHFFNLPAHSQWAIFVCYSIINLLLFSLRYKFGDWKKIILD